MTDQVLIYITGAGDTAMRQATGILFERKQVTRVDLHDASTMRIKRDCAKVGTVGRAMVVATDQQNLEGVMRHLKAELGDEVRAWAVPVLASL